MSNQDTTRKLNANLLSLLEFHRTTKNEWIEFRPNHLNFWKELIYMLIIVNYKEPIKVGTWIWSVWVKIRFRMKLSFFKFYFLSLFFFSIFSERTLLPPIILLLSSLKLIINFNIQWLYINRYMYQINEIRVPCHLYKKKHSFNVFIKIHQWTAI